MEVLSFTEYQVKNQRMLRFARQRILAQSKSISNRLLGFKPLSDCSQALLLILESEMRRASSAGRCKMGPLACPVPGASGQQSNGLMRTIACAKCNESKRFNEKIDVPESSSCSTYIVLSLSCQDRLDVQD